jgi:hypothetical protein
VRPGFRERVSHANGFTGAARISRSRDSQAGAVGRSYPAAVRQLNGAMVRDRFPATVVKISIHMILKVI